MLDRFADRDRLAAHVREKLLAAIGEVPREDVPDLYVISLWLEDQEDDPRRPVVRVGYNTERKVVASTPSATTPRKPEPSDAFTFDFRATDIASDAAEARWNFAFWLQNCLVPIFDETADADGQRLLERWAKEAGLWYSDEDEAHDLNAAVARGQRLTNTLVNVLVDVVRDLHRGGELARSLGRPVPVLIHELEYYEEIARQNEAANPPELVWDFAAWVRGRA